MLNTDFAFTPVSPGCSADGAHHACTQNDAAWDFFLDQPTDCMCRCHFAANAVSSDCRNPSRHDACPQHGAAWDFVLDRSADCVCHCHARAAVPASQP